MSRRLKDKKDQDLILVLRYELVAYTFIFLQRVDDPENRKIVTNTYTHTYSYYRYLNHNIMCTFHKYGGQYARAVYLSFL